MMLTKNVRILNNSKSNLLLNLIKKHSSCTENCVEVQIPVPWGHVSGKWWGSTEKRPVLVLHGYQDNCGSFDRLLPELSSEFSFLAIDFPGHGYSSQLPKGMFYNFLMGPLLIRQIIEYFKWPKVSLMGHSMGSIMSYTYGTYLPDTVDMLVCIDGLYPFVLPNHTERNGTLLNKFIKYMAIGEKAGEPPTYTFAEMEKKLYEGAKKSVNLEYCKYILKRNSNPSKINPGKYYFNIDPRLKAGPYFEGNPMTFLQDANRINFPLFMCIPSGSPFFAGRKQDIIDLLKSKPNVDSHIIDGSHHVHLNEPEVVQKLLHPFLVKNYTCDRSIGGIKEEIRVCL